MHHCVTTAIVLMLTALVHGQAAQGPERWQPQIDAFVKQDQAAPPPKGAIVFVGSSSIRRWKLAESFPNRPVLNRGFGGSQMADAAHYVDRIVHPYEPAAVVVYSGDNDIAGGKSPQQIADDGALLVRKVRDKLPATPIVILSVKPSIKRLPHLDAIRQTNALLESLAKAEKHVFYVDVFAAMLDAKGQPRAEPLIGDGLHLSSDGYALWTRRLEPVLDRIVGPARAAESERAIEELARKHLAASNVAACSVAVVKDGRVLLARGFGTADLENDVPATAETVYRLGSITKQFTAMAVLQLADRGKLKLDDPLTRFVPDFPVREHKVTVHHLLNHTSGIRSYTGMGPAFWSKARLDLPHDQMLAIFKDQPFDFAPGTQWSYNNSGYYLLGIVIEKASGQTYPAYLEDHIFRPLGMTATRYDSPRAVIKHRARGYARLLGALSNADMMSMHPPGAAGGLVSNVLDLAKWHLALEEGRLLPPELYARMYQRTQLAGGKTYPYGYGWTITDWQGRKVIGHGGGIFGFNTSISRYLDDRLAVIVLANTEAAEPQKLDQAIAARVLGLAAKPPAPPAKTGP